jgi:hypothetical protein
MILDAWLVSQLLDAWGVRLAMSRPVRRRCERARSLLFVASRPEQWPPRRHTFGAGLKRPSYR